MLGTILGAAIPAIGSLIGGKMQQDASQDFAREQMDFQERMSSTAHQRQVEDLRAAGLNPILSTRLGGASSPSGAMGTAVDFVGNAARAGTSSALQANAQSAQIDLLKAQERKTDAEARGQDLTNVITASDASDQGILDRRRKVQQEYMTGHASEQLQIEQRWTQRFVQEVLKAQGSSAASQATIDKIAADLAKTEFGKKLFQFGAGGRALLPFGNMLNSGKSLIQ